MKFVIYTNSASPHQMPLARRFAEYFGEEEFRYVCINHLSEERQNLGWRMSQEKWIVSQKNEKSLCAKWLETCDILLSSLRDVELFEKRARLGLTTIVQTERWLRPPIGLLRMLSPSYWRMAKRFVSLLSHGDVKYLPIGIHAASDMAQLCGLICGDIRCSLRSPRLNCEYTPCGRISLIANDRNAMVGRCLENMRLWGYFVEPSETESEHHRFQAKSEGDVIRVLWVGRLLRLKRVDTIVRAVGKYASLNCMADSRPKIVLDIYGVGPESHRLRKLAAKYGDMIKFYPQVPIVEVRELMRSHDIYVLASNGYEGWGAVVSEALEEGMKVIGTYEAGSSATILPKANLFHAGDWERLMDLLQDPNIGGGIGRWSVCDAMNQFLKILPVQ